MYTISWWNLQIQQRTHLGVEWEEGPAPPASAAQMEFSRLGKETDQLLTQSSK